MNELVLYLLCMILLVYQGAFPRMYEKRFDVFDSFFEDVNTFFGYLIISLVLLYIIYNLIVIIYDSIIG